MRTARAAAAAAAETRNPDPRPDPDPQPTAASPFRDASAAQPRLPDPGPLDAETFAAIVRAPVKIGEALRCDERHHHVSTGELNTLTGRLRTFGTHATAEWIIFRRRPADLLDELEYKRRPFFRLAAILTDVGYLERHPAGVRGVVEYRVRRVPPLALLVTSSAPVGTARGFPLLPTTTTHRGPTDRTLAADLDVDATGKTQAELYDANAAALTARVAHAAAKRAAAKRPPAVRCLCDLPAGGRCNRPDGHHGTCGEDR